MNLQEPTNPPESAAPLSSGEHGNNNGNRLRKFIKLVLYLAVLFLAGITVANVIHPPHPKPPTPTLEQLRNLQGDPIDGSGDKPDRSSLYANEALANNGDPYTGVTFPKFVSILAGKTKVVRDFPHEYTGDRKQFLKVDFRFLGQYEYLLPKDFTTFYKRPVNESFKQIPEEIRRIHGKKVALSGFMNPIQSSIDGVREFYLTRDQGMCCYGIMPRINEMVVVRMNAGNAPFINDKPIEVHGTLRVGEFQDLGAGDISHVYEINGIHVKEAVIR